MKIRVIVNVTIETLPESSVEYPSRTSYTETYPAPLAANGQQSGFVMHNWQWANQILPDNHFVVMMKIRQALKDAVDNWQLPHPDQKA